MRTTPSIRSLLAPLALALAVQFPSTLLAQVIIAGNDNKALVVDGQAADRPAGRAIRVRHRHRRGRPDAARHRQGAEQHFRPADQLGRQRGQPPGAGSGGGDDRSRRLAAQVRAQRQIARHRSGGGSAANHRHPRRGPPALRHVHQPRRAHGDHRQPRRDFRVGAQHRRQAGALRGQGGDGRSGHPRGVHAGRQTRDDQQGQHGPGVVPGHRRRRGHPHRAGPGGG